MNKQIKEITKYDVTDNIIEENYGDLYELVSQNADNYVIYNYDCWKIVNDASQEEVDAASQQMKEMCYVFKDMDQAMQRCAYWIKHNELMNDAKEELEEDRDTLQEKLDELEEIEETTEEQEELISDLEDAIYKIEENI